MSVLNTAISSLATHNPGPDGVAGCRQAVETGKHRLGDVAGLLSETLGRLLVTGDPSPYEVAGGRHAFQTGRHRLGDVAAFPSKALGGLR